MPLLQKLSDIAFKQNFQTNGNVQLPEVLHGELDTDHGSYVQMLVPSGDRAWISCTDVLTFTGQMAVAPHSDTHHPFGCLDERHKLLNWSNSML